MPHNTRLQGYPERVAIALTIDDMSSIALGRNVRPDPSCVPYLPTGAAIARFIRIWIGSRFLVSQMHDGVCELWPDRAATWNESKSTRPPSEKTFITQRMPTIPHSFFFFPSLPSSEPPLNATPATWFRLLSYPTLTLSPWYHLYPTSCVTAFHHPMSFCDAEGWSVFSHRRAMDFTQCFQDRYSLFSPLDSTYMDTGQID